MIEALCGLSKDAAHFNVVVVVCIEEIINVAEQFGHIPASVISGDALVQVPPDAFNRIGLGSILRKEVKLYSALLFLHILANETTVVKRGIVTDHVNDSIATQAPAQFLEVIDKQLGVSAEVGGRHIQSSGSPIEGAA